MKRIQVNFLKIFGAMLCVATLFGGYGTFEVNAESYIPYEGASYELTYKSVYDGIAISGYTGTAEGELIIPCEIDGKSVVAIGMNAFTDCEGFRGVLQLPETLKRIEELAFSSCTGFYGDLIIPNSVEFIGVEAFSHCTGLDGELVLSESLRTMNSGAFSYCENLTGALVLPQGLSIIDEKVFYGCSGLYGELVIPDNVCRIEVEAFSGCSQIESLVLSKNITIICPKAFCGCRSLKWDVDIPESMLYIEEYAFAHCTNLTGELVFPCDMRMIGSYSFTGCEKLSADVYVSENVTDMGEHALDSHMVIHAPEGSTAHQYAQSNGNAYVKWDNIFKDVDMDEWYYAPVKYVYDSNFMNGVDIRKSGLVTFAPKTYIPREQFVTMLYKKDKPGEMSYVLRFTDIVDDTWYTDAVLWAEQQGIVNGITETEFGLGQQITREQIATMLHRYATEYNEYDTTLKGTVDLLEYPDGSAVNSWAQTAMQWAIENGIITGKLGANGTGNILDPGGFATRAECAAMLQRFIQKYECGESHNFVWETNGDTRTKKCVCGATAVTEHCYNGCWGYFDDAGADELWYWINVQRNSTIAGIVDDWGNPIGIVNVASLIEDSALTTKARSRAFEAAINFDHGSNSDECLAWGCGSAVEAYEALCFSISHLRAMTNPKYIYGGIACFWYDADNSGENLVPVWVLELGRQKE